MIFDKVLQMMNDLVLVPLHVFHPFLELVVSFEMCAFILLEVLLPYLVILDILQAFLLNVFLQITYL